MSTKEDVIREEVEVAGPSPEDGIGELSWPRLVAPPLKRSGHVILEVCTASGKLQARVFPSWTSSSCD